MGVGFVVGVGLVVGVGFVVGVGEVLLVNLQLLEKVTSSMAIVPTWGKDVSLCVLGATFLGKLALGQRFFLIFHLLLIAHGCPKYHRVAVVGGNHMLRLQRSKLISEPTLIQKISLGLLASVSSKVRNDTDPFPLVDVTAPSSLASESLKNSDSWRVTPTQILTYKVFL